MISGFAPIDDSQHAARQLATPLERLALYLEDHAASLHPSDADREFAEKFLEPAGKSPVIAIHAGSGSAKKNWPVDRWAELGRLLLDRNPEARLLLIGGEADGAQIQSLRNAWTKVPLLIASDLPLPELAAVLERATLFLGHDSGISHMAAAAGTRCVLLFGPTDPAIWAPANARVQVISAPSGDLTQLPVEQVAAAVEPVLAGRI